MSSSNSPRHTWSPHTAALHRRRNVVPKKNKETMMDSLSSLNLEDDEAQHNEVFGRNQTKVASPVSEKAKATKALTADSKARKEDTEAELKAFIKTVPKHVQGKLKTIMSPKTPMKERLELEVLMMRNEEERKYLTEFRLISERKTYLVKRAETEEEIQEQLHHSFKEEDKRAAQEKKELDEKRRIRVEAEIAQRERELQIEKKAEKHAVEAIAQGAEEVRKEAEAALAAAQEKKALKAKQVKERQRKVEEFRQGEGKYLTDVERALKEAVIEQVEISN